MNPGYYLLRCSSPRTAHSYELLSRTCSFWGAQHEETNVCSTRNMMHLSVHHTWSRCAGLSTRTSNSKTSCFCGSQVYRPKSRKIEQHLRSHGDRRAESAYFSLPHRLCRAPPLLEVGCCRGNLLPRASLKLPGLPPPSLSLFTRRARLHVVLCARWGLRLLRQWAADDAVYKALERSPVRRRRSEEKPRLRRGWHAGGSRRAGSRPNVVKSMSHHQPRGTSRGGGGGRRLSGSGGRSDHPRVRMSAGDDAGGGTSTASAGGEFGNEAGCLLRLAAPAGESNLRLAWTNPRGNTMSVHLFTPGGRPRWGCCGA